MYELSRIRTKVIGPDHEHIELVGYRSPHIDQEPIMITPERLATRIALGEAFGVRVGDDLAEVKPATCPICGESGHLKSAKDTKDFQHLLALPQK